MITVKAIDVIILVWNSFVRDRDPPLDENCGGGRLVEGGREEYIYVIHALSRRVFI